MLAAALETQHDVALVPGDGGVEVTGLVDLADQLGGNHLGAAAVVAVVAREYGTRVVVEGVERQDVAGHVVVELDGGVYAEQQRPGRLLRRGELLRGQALGRDGGRAALPAPGEDEQRGGRGGDTYRFDVELLHLSHLLNLCVFRALFFAYTHRLRSALPQTGVGGKNFLKNFLRGAYAPLSCLGKGNGK